ncbi:hypothetical protein T08_8085 [Trichinella sp. T8]|nr:hypothetical protein T08_8085 [Trichinella sp. T8]
MRRTNPPVDAGASSNSDDHVSNPVSCCDERARPPQRLVSLLLRRLVKYSYYALASVRYVLRVQYLLINTNKHKSQEPTAMGPLVSNNHTTANAVVTRCRASTTLKNVVWNCRRVLYACGAQIQICQTFVRQANESGLYNVDSSWPTECGQSRRRSRGLNASGSNTPRIRVRFIRQRTIRRTYSVDSSSRQQSICNRNKQWHENSMITQTTAISTEFRVHRYPYILFSFAARFMALYVEPEVGVPSGWLEPPMSSSLTAGALAISGADLNHRRLPIKLS